jgi:hypothetical protein
VPVAAARKPEIGAADPQPAVGGGLGEHVVEERLVGLLDRVALGQRAAGLADALGERVPDLLELTQVENARRSRSGDPMRDDHAPEPVGDQATELALEPGDLPAQLGAGQTLVDRDSVEHSPHGPILSRLEGRGRNP